MAVRSVYVTSQISIVLDSATWNGDRLVTQTPVSAPCIGTSRNKSQQDDDTSCTKSYLHLGRVQLCASEKLQMSCYHEQRFSSWVILKWQPPQHALPCCSVRICNRLFVCLLLEKRDVSRVGSWGTRWIQIGGQKKDVAETTLNAALMICTRLHLK